MDTPGGRLFIAIHWPRLLLLQVSFSYVWSLAGAVSLSVFLVVGFLVTMRILMLVFFVAVLLRKLSPCCGGCAWGSLFSFVIALPNECVPHRRVLQHGAPSSLLSLALSSGRLLVVVVPFGDRCW